MRLTLLMFLLITLCYSDAWPQAQTVFTGSPSLKLSEGGIERTTEEVSQKDAANLRCVISKIGNKFYWASRENKELLRVESGSFITFISKEGAGYIRFINSDLKATASFMSETETEFDYVEHMLIGLRSVTYYGKEVR